MSAGVGTRLVTGLNVDFDVTFVTFCICICICICICMRWSFLRYAFSLRSPSFTDLCSTRMYPPPQKLFNGIFHISFMLQNSMLMLVPTLMYHYLHLYPRPHPHSHSLCLMLMLMFPFPCVFGCCDTRVRCTYHPLQLGVSASIQSNPRRCLNFITAYCFHHLF